MYIFICFCCIIFSTYIFNLTAEYRPILKNYAKVGFYYTLQVDKQALTLDLIGVIQSHSIQFNTNLSKPLNSF